MYLPETTLAVQLGDALRRIKMTPEIVEWTREALLSSHADQAEHHRATVARLNARKEKLASYLDQAYTDRLEGRISEDLWQRRSSEWDQERPPPIEKSPKKSRYFSRNNCGEGGIRTRGQVLARRPLSKRVPSASRSPLQVGGTVHETSSPFKV